MRSARSTRDSSSTLQKCGREERLAPLVFLNNEQFFLFLPLGNELHYFKAVQAHRGQAEQVKRLSAMCG